MWSEYIPTRKMHYGSGIGMNPPGNGKRFGRMADAFAHDAAYWGDHGDWYIVASQHRDSDTVDRSNFQVLLKQLGGESDTVAVEQASHWLVGWVEYLIVAPTDHKALRTAILAHSAVSTYPILDESEWSQLEYDEAWEWAERELKEYDGWETVMAEVWSEGSYGYGDEEAGQAISEAEERLKERQALVDAHAASLIDPAQGKLWGGISDRVI
jgi:hypothetical protein